MRYRTGDYASLSIGTDAPVLVGLSGRRPVRFRTQCGQWVNNIDVTHALHPLAISHFSFHQYADGAVTLRLAPGAMSLADQARIALSTLFGKQIIQVELLAAEDKVVQYTSEFEGALT